MDVLLLSRYGPLGSTSRIRFYQYLPFLERHGIQVSIQPMLPDPYVENLYAGRSQDLLFLLRAYWNRLRALIASRTFDLVWLEKELMPWLPAWGEALLNARKIPYVVDYDDATFHRYDHHRQFLVRLLLGGKIDRVMQRATLVVAGSDYLADHARRSGARRVATLPSVVDLDRYRPDQRANADNFRIGWIGAPITARYLSLIREPLAMLAGQGARVTLVGSGPVDLGEIPVEIRPWSEGREVSDIQEFDVGIMPLPDEPFERGKCGYKLIQYMGCGLPVVASPIGVNQELVEPGVNGFLADSAVEWIESLKQLRQDAGLRMRMGQAGFDKVKRSYSLQVTAPQLLDLLRRAARVSP